MKRPKKVRLTVGRRGEILIPKHLREAIEIGPGTEVVLERKDDVLVIKNPEFSKKWNPRLDEYLRSWREAERLRDWRLIRKGVRLGSYDEEEEGMEWYYDEEG